MRAENRPSIVSLEWILDCMEQGALVDPSLDKDKYLVQV